MCYLLGCFSNSVQRYNFFLICANFFAIFLHFFSFFRIFFDFLSVLQHKNGKKKQKNARVSQRRRAQNFMCYEKQIYPDAKVLLFSHTSKFYADILRDFCERKLRLVVLPVSACPYILRSVHIYKRLGRNTVVLQ